jgi:pimeloyl-ACP methyl ester carboxylesterase
MVAMGEFTIARAGAVLDGEERGSGPVLGFSHGMFFSRSVDDELGVFDLTPFTRRRHLVRYDARAHGRSSGRAVPDDYVWPNYADDLLAVIDHVEPDGGPVDWAGASLGTSSLLWAASRAPHRFRRLILEIPPSTGQTRAAVGDFYRDGADLVEREGKDAWLKTLVAYAVPPVFAELESWGLRVDVSQELLPSVLRGAARTDLPDAAALAAITQPTLVLAWETDPVHPVSSAVYLAETLPHATLHVSPNLADVQTWPERIGAFLDM